MIVFDHELAHAVGMRGDLFNNLDSAFAVSRQNSVGILDSHEGARRDNLAFFPHKEDLRSPVVDRTVFLLPVPSDLEAQHVAVVGLGFPDIGHRQLRRCELPIRR